MKVVALKIRFYGIFLWKKTNSPPEYIENLVSVSLDIAIRLNIWVLGTTLQFLERGISCIKEHVLKDYKDFDKLIEFDPYKNTAK